jgi:glutamate-ammonia-ligase adenylyltransferase
MADLPPIDWRETAELEEVARKHRVGQHFTALDLAHAARASESFARLLRLPIFQIAADRVARALKTAAKPDRAMLAFEDAVMSLEERRGDASPLFVDPILGMVIELSGASGRAARMLSRDPALAIELGTRSSLHAEPDHLAPLLRVVDAAGEDTASFDRLLRRYRNRQMLAIALRELREGDVRQTSRELADLADAAIEAALRHHLPILEAQLGRPEPPCARVVFGMGKLGGRELNFSSDIDLIYFFEHDEGRAGAVSIHQFHVKLFERITVSLARITEHGFVFRVDLDLRPEGKTGTIANSLASAERYYESWGRTWERAAWVRGRPIAGSIELGERILGMMRPFVYRKSFDLRAIEEIFAMKTKIDAARKRAGRSPINAGRDLKLGEGGIREIEFFVQAQQLLHGGRDPTLRQTNTLEALIRLEAAASISARTRELLADAYLFLRKVEHRVQIVEEMQTHSLPTDPEDLAAVSRSLGFTAPSDLLGALEHHMKGVHELFVQRLGRAHEEETTPPAIELLMEPGSSAEEKTQTLGDLGARDPHSALINLERAAMHPQSPFHPHAPTARRTLASALLAECASSPSFDRALTHLPDLIRSLLLHASYLEGLERPTLRRGVARVLGASDLLSRILVSNPALLPNVLLAKELPSPESIDRDLSARLLDAKGDVESALVILRNVKQEEILRTAMADLAGLIDVATVGERLSVLAEILIRKAFDLAREEMVGRYGEPTKADGSLAEIVIIAGGTLGAYEIGYRSDVDLAVIYEGEGDTRGGDRAPITSAELFTRIVQRMLTFLTLKTKEGDLYPVDTRLRPSGNKGALVASLANFESYHEKVAQLWERQALIRSRTVAGSEALRARVDRAIARAAYDAGPVEGANKRIHEMRVRMEKERSEAYRRRMTSSLDLKLGTGGLVEAEFLVQDLLIQHGAAHPEIRSTSTRRALDELGRASILEPSLAQRLIRAVDRLRAVQNWLRLAHDAMIDRVDLSPTALRPLALAIGYQGESAQTLLERDLRTDTGAIHSAYADTVEAQGGPVLHETNEPRTRHEDDSGH